MMERPLHVLVVHNAYQTRGGEDSVVEAEVDLLREQGHRVTRYSRHNDEIPSMAKLDVARDTLWSRRTTADIRSFAAASRPDLIHVHNTFPLISPSVYWAARRQGLPVVQTLHNFRLHCPQAMYLRDGRICEDCLGGPPLASIRHGCYRGSRPQTALVAGMLMMHRSVGTWQRLVTRYIALNRFCRDKFVEGGLPAESIRIKPNFVDFPPPPAGPRDGLLFVGRLSEEKGVAMLAAAVGLACPGKLPAVRVAGVGPESAALGEVPGLRLLGAMSLEAVRHEMASARALVLPSICYESFPRTLVEAYGCGLPVIASRMGALAELVEDGVTGLLVPPGDAAKLAECMQWAQDHPAEMAAMGRAARARYEQLYTPEANYRQLMAIYAEAIGAGQAGADARPRSA